MAVEIDKEKLYRTAFFLTYHKEARDGWFWRVFGMSADVKMRETLLKMTKEYQELVSKRAITFDEYLDLMRRQEQEKISVAPSSNKTNLEAVKAFQKQYGLVDASGLHKGEKQLNITITTSIDQDFEDSFTEVLAAVCQHLKDGSLAHNEKIENGHYSFIVKQT